MFDLIFWTVLLISNLYFGIGDIKSKKPTNWRVALTWAAVGISTFSWIKAVSFFL